MYSIVDINSLFLEIMKIPVPIAHSIAQLVVSLNYAWPDQGNVESLFQWGQEYYWQASHE